jgi:hypothetical protein
MQEKASPEKILARVKKIASHETPDEQAALRIARAALAPRIESIWDGFLGAFLRPALVLTAAALVLIAMTLSAPSEESEEDDIRDDYVAALIGDTP